MRDLGTPLSPPWPSLNTGSKTQRAIDRAFTSNCWQFCVRTIWVPLQGVKLHPHLRGALADQRSLRA